MKRIKMIIAILFIFCLLMLCITARIYDLNFGYRTNITSEETLEILSQYPELRDFY